MTIAYQNLQNMIKDVFSILRESITIPLVANIPHSSTHIPPLIRQSFVLNDDDLERELLKKTDRYVDELFRCVYEMGGVSFIYNHSRLVVDPERFEDDAQEVMAPKGLGVIYTKTSDGHKLRTDFPSEEERQELLNVYYRPYHRAIEDEVNGILDSFGGCLVLDCHSFPSKPLPCDLNQEPNRPDICLGTDSFHTPKPLVELVESFFREQGLTTALDMPFAGTYVPLKLLGTDRRVSSLMVEINRKLYMDETTGERSDAFDEIKNVVANMVKCVSANILQPKVGRDS